jgi:7-cyano-7-deazaguanine reductase
MKKPDGLTLLGDQSVSCPTEYSPGLLEAFDNQHPDRDYMVTFDCPEFTALCPITGQPDFARIVVNYLPDLKMVESKSLKLYLFSFRNHGSFHEACVNIILDDLRRLMNPRYIEVLGRFAPRGGICIHPYACWGRPDTKYAEMAEYRLRRHGV